MKFFKPEDFEDGSLISASCAAGRANAKLVREGKIAYGCLASDGLVISMDKDNTHKYLQINIEPIEACTHPAEKVTKNLAAGMAMGEDWYNLYTCECGATLKATFEEVK